MNILITGGSGLLGQYLNIILSKENNILTLYNENTGNCNEFNSKKISLTGYSELNNLFSEFKPDAVIHTAAISRPELCDELPKEFVIDVNINSTIYLAELCEKYNSKLIFTSTDLVYDGNQGLMLKEDALLNPVSFYAETKIKSEEEIKKVFNNYIILRTSLLYGMGINHSVNNFHNMLLNFQENKKVKLFFDQYRTPLSLNNAAEIINDLLKLNLKNITINFGGRERVSRVELGEILCRTGKFENILIEKTSMYDIPNLHKVRDVSMNTDLLQSYGIRQNTIEEEIGRIMNNE